jgi:hypothetical protein
LSASKVFTQLSRVRHLVVTVCCFGLKHDSERHLHIQSHFIGQDSGDVFAMMRTGYNFDGVQNPVVIRQGDPVVGNPVLSVANFYGAHG